MTRFESAKEQYAAWGVDVEKALAALREVPVSIHCWQGDDVTGWRAAARPFPGAYRPQGIIPDGPGALRS